MNTYSENLLKAKDIIGSFNKVGKLCGVTGKAIMKWAIAGKPPRTEYTGETHYAEIISMAVHGAVSRDDLLPILRINVEIPIINQRAQIERQTTERRNQ